MKVDWHLEASADLVGILVHIAEDSPASAYRMREEILSCVAHLDSHPMMGRPGRVKGTRELVVSGTPYVTVYDLSGEGPLILRILHGAQRWPG